MAASNGLISTLQGGISKLIDIAIANSSKLVTFALVSIVLLMSWFGFNSFRHPAYTVTTTADVRNLIISGVHDLTELTTASTNSKATVTVNQEKKVFGIPLGDTNLVYEGVGVIRAGINIANLEVMNLDVPQHKIEIQLPSPYISEVNLKLEKSSTLANYRHWFGEKAGVELYEQAQNQAIFKIKQEACANNILEVASRNAGNLTKQILAKAGFEDIQINVEPANKLACSAA